jgi:transcriptional regulator GlxA family with amidase domain
MTSDNREITIPSASPGAIERPIQVAFLLVPGFSLLAFSAACESLRAANQISGSDLYRWHYISVVGAAATAVNGIEIRCDRALIDQYTYDYVFVCASDDAAKVKDELTLSWLRRQAQDGSKMGGIGGGAFLLARAGLLDRKRLTLHWVYAPTFLAEFPDADLHRSLYEIDGDIMTCGGGTSPLDMMHVVLRDAHGPDLALGVAELFLHTDIREGQNAQRLSIQARLGVHNPGLIRALESMEDALETPLSRSELAHIAGISERQLDRLFVAQLGDGLSAYYLKLRLKRSRELVLQTTLALTEIAAAGGFKSLSTFSKSYRTQYGSPPSRDRNRALLRRRERI